MSSDMTITMSSAHSQPFRHFTYVTTHSPTLPSLYLGHSSFSNPSVASPTSQFILQPFFPFFYVTSSSLNSPGEPPMLYHNYKQTMQWIIIILMTIEPETLISFVNKIKGTASLSCHGFSLGLKLITYCSSLETITTNNKHAGELADAQMDEDSDD